MKNLFFHHFNFFMMVIFGYFLMMVGSNLTTVYLIEMVFWESKSMGMAFNVLVDWMSLIFVGTVMVISGSVLIYTKWYMMDERYFKRFVSLVLFFVLSMTFMIFVPNLIGILIGWDGLGLTSFLLVCYYHNKKSLAASVLTALTNRIGDVLILACISCMTVENAWMLYQFNFGKPVWGLVSLLVLASMTKSAQVPFCSWLPAAMAAPTPVSALVHSSTLVTAGVYLLIRSFKLISLDPSIMSMLKVLSLITLCLAGTSALVCLDLKKVVALSTLSQLSVMMFSISLYAPALAFFHLVTHALFKALLFLSVGTVIHSYGNLQDIRMVGNCWSALPKSMSAMVIAVSSLSGLPFLSGFFSKDLIIDTFYMSSTSFMESGLMSVGVSMTSIYSLRLVWMSLFSLNTASVCSAVVSGEKMNVTFPYLCLSGGALFAGYKLSEQVMSFSSFSGSSNVEIIILVTAFFISLLFMLINKDSLYFNMLLMAWYKNPSLSLRLILSFVRGVYPFLLSMWCMENVSSQPLSSVSLYFSEKLSLSLDKGWLESVGPQGTFSKLMTFSQNNELFQKKFFMSCLGGMVSLMAVLFFIVCVMF
uniref:NADH-ubiquinone oxidoreductase chain 5 n=1 Tax=Arcuatula senhousia TaxID=1954227 RepID=E2DHX3_ARCSE|nr:NADH dehydrogenase subunit 5 [Arcuatula senhousia]ACY00234.1 NADH dehydrogenase subunit 5 [Arcuatula senhousia]